MSTISNFLNTLSNQIHYLVHAELEETYSIEKEFDQTIEFNPDNNTSIICSSNNLGKSFDQRFNIALIGDYSSGKKSVVYRHLYDRTLTSTSITSAADLIATGYQADKQTIKVLYWFLLYSIQRPGWNKASANYIQKQNAIFAVVDITKENNLSYAEALIKHIKKECSKVAKPLPLIVLISTKNDSTNPAMSHEQLQNLAFEHHINYYATSAKSNDSIQLIFEDCIKRLLQQANRQITNTQSTSYKKLC